MIPIKNVDGEVIGFGGRVLPSYMAETAKNKYKYINSPTSPGNLSSSL